MTSNNLKYSFFIKTALLIVFIFAVCFLLLVRVARYVDYETASFEDRLELLDFTLSTWGIPANALEAMPPDKSSGTPSWHFVSSQSIVPFGNQMGCNSEGGIVAASIVMLSKTIVIAERSEAWDIKNTFITKLNTLGEYEASVYARNVSSRILKENLNEYREKDKPLGQQHQE